jgi:hypothetical protein
MFSLRAARLGKRKRKEGNHIQTICALYIPTSIPSARRLQHCDLSAPVSSHSKLLRPTRSAVEVSRVHTTHQQNGDHDIALLRLLTNRPHRLDPSASQPRYVSVRVAVRLLVTRVQFCGCFFLRLTKQTSTRRVLASGQLIELSSEALPGKGWILRCSLWLA